MHDYIPTEYIIIEVIVKLTFSLSCKKMIEKSSRVV